MRILAVANQKGGVGKTTTTLNLGAALRECGRSVLLIDLDPQASLTASLGIKPDSLDLTIYDALSAAVKGEERPGLREIVTESDGLALAPANIVLSKADRELVLANLGVYALRDALVSARDAYDYVLLDCPPSLGIMTDNALAAADNVLIPMATDYLAWRGLALLLDSIAMMQKRTNRGLKIAGVVLTMADSRLAHTREIIEAVHANLGSQVRVFETVIHMSVRLKEAPMTGHSILTYAKDSTGARGYRDLARELEAIWQSA